MNKLIICVTLVSAFFLSDVDCLRRFWRGRRFELESKLLGADPDLWFEQKLDHFNPTNNASWNQVKNFFVLIMYKD